MDKCEWCGQIIREDDEFCHGCGARVSRGYDIPSSVYPYHINPYISVRTGPTADLSIPNEKNEEAPKLHCRKCGAVMIYSAKFHHYSKNGKKLFEVFYRCPNNHKKMAIFNDNGNKLDAEEFGFFSPNSTDLVFEDDLHLYEQ